MSNSLSVSAVTATLRNLLDLGTRDSPAGTSVTARPPDRARGALTGNQLNVFLYQTTVNASWANADMPGRVKSGESGFPPLPLTLHYLLTAYGENDEDLLGHQLLGRAMSILHDHAVLLPEDIRGALAPDGEPRPNLQDQPERVRITYQPMSLDDMSKLWTTFQTQYRISAAYQASVVLIESDRPVRTPLPVLRQGDQDRGPSATPDLAPPFPTLTAVRPPDPRFSAQLGDTLSLSGHHLAGAIEVRFRHTQLSLTNVVVPLAGATDGLLAVALPDDAAAAVDWPAGVYTVAVALPETVNGEVFERVTNEAPLALAPRIVSMSPEPAIRDPNGDVVLTVTFRPDLRAGQPVALLLGDREVRPQALPAVPDQAATLDFTVTDAAVGQHFARLRVGGIDSILLASGVTPAEFDSAQRVTVQ